MSITREQVADLREGDVVEMTWPDGTLLRGPIVTRFEGWLYLGPYLLRPGSVWTDKGNYPEDATLTVVSRAPRLYVNHPRTEPRHRDIVLDKDGDAWQRKGNSWYFPGGTAEGANDISDCAPLRLLVDGETGQVVP